MEEFLPRYGAGTATSFEGEDRTARWEVAGGGNPFGPQTPAPAREWLYETNDPLFRERLDWVEPRGASDTFITTPNVGVVAVRAALREVEHTLLVVKSGKSGVSYAAITATMKG